MSYNSKTGYIYVYLWYALLNLLNKESECRYITLMHSTHRYSPALQQMVSWLMTVSPSERPFINEVIQRVETLQYSAENRVWHLSWPFFCDEHSTWPCHIREMCWNLCTWGSVFSSLGKLIAVHWGTCVVVINRYAPSSWDTLSLLTGAGLFWPSQRNSGLCPWWPWVPKNCISKI